jgi:hypothetical protein
MTIIDYTLSPLAIEAALEDKAAALAFFLLDNTGSIFGHWQGRMTANDQRALLGRFVGKGLLIINGNDETIYHNVSVCFGTMRDNSWSRTWTELVEGK